jgi:hypothetical protein
MAIVVRFILIALFVVLIFYVLQRLLQWWQIQDDWKVLLNICHGDQERAKRLIQHEKRTNPGITDEEACRRAIGRYHRDNR